jgi:phage shock protein PspC (stress-responsive transcriptional regulator)
MSRPVEGRVIAGVALAVADRLGMSPGAVRLIWFIAAFFGGLGVLLYIAGWLLIPEEAEERSIAEEVTGQIGDLTTWIGVGLIAVATIILVSEVGWISSDLAWAVALLAVGVLLYRGHLGTWSGGPEPVGDDGVAAEPTQALADDHGFEQVAPDGSAPAKMARRRARLRSILGRMTLGTIFIVLGTMLVLDTSGVIRPAFTHYLATAVAIVGAGLLVGSVYGRSRGLIVLGLLLVPVMLASSVVTAEFDGGWGDPVFRPGSLDAIDARYGLTGGDLELDLSRVDLGSGEVRIEGDVGFGRLLVLVPEGVGVDVHAHVGFGDVDVLGERRDGVDVGTRVVIEGTGLYELHLDVGFGQVQVREVAR